VKTHRKQRRASTPGTIPDRLQMFAREVRFYREVAPRLDVRVPSCFRAEINPDGSTLLELEDLSTWREGADLEPAARLLAGLHSRGAEAAVETWPWIVREDASDLVEVLFDETWPSLRARRDLTDRARRLGDSLVGRVVEAERDAERAGPPTLTHGDASFNNMRTSPSGEIALLDWEDFGLGPGTSDLAWLLISSADPREWDAGIDAYAEATGLATALRAATVQAFLSLNAEDEGSKDALSWVANIDEASRRM
jgi:thiamine kinase-like enzyme